MDGSLWCEECRLWKEMQGLSGDAGRELKIKFWSQCLVFPVHHGVWAPQQNSLTALKFHCCYVVSDFSTWCFALWHHGVGAPQRNFHEGLS